MPPRPEPEPADPTRKRGADGTDRRRLAELKRAIKNGEYETPEKLEATLARLLADLRKAAAAKAAKAKKANKRGQ